MAERRSFMTEIPRDPATVMASSRTEMSLERTAMSSDNTLMAVVRTSLSLISFGFTIFQFFLKLSNPVLKMALPTASPRRFAFSLILLGVVLLVLGILNHLHEARRGRQRRQGLAARGLISDYAPQRVSTPLLVASLLLVIGLLAMAGVGLRAGPFLG